MAGFNLLGIGSQALNANRSALATVSQNISNASTEGYSRQKSDFMSIGGLGGSYIQSISRSTDQFLVKQTWSDISNYNSLNLHNTLISKTDNLLATSTTSISTALDTYFKSMQNAVDDPTSLANRELYIEEMDALSRRFNNLSANLKIQNESVNSTLKSSADDLTQYSQSIAKLNDQINYAEVRKLPVNELKDQRNVVIGKMSEIVDIKVVENGRDFNVYVGNGQPLVVGQTVNTVEVRPGDPDKTQSEVYIKMSGDEQKITGLVSGGKLGGAIDFREKVLNPSLNELGRIALALTSETNTQHKKGMNLNNELGTDVFKDINTESFMRSRIKGKTDNSAQINVARVQITDTTKLTTNDYDITVNDNNEILVKRLPQGSVINLTKVATDPAVVDNSYFLDSAAGNLHLKVDGLDITVDAVGSLYSGNEFVVQPTRSASGDISSVLTDPKQLALASPIRTTVDPDNTGSGAVSVEVTDPNDLVFSEIGTTGKLKPPVEIVFDNNTPMRFTVFDMTTPSNPQPLSAALTNVTYTAPQEVALPGYKVTIDQLPKAGDRFGFDFNKDGFSDNKNALALSAIQTKTVLQNGSLQDHYSGLIEQVGAKTATSKVNLKASESVLKSTQASLASVMGVNLDEEAARLVQFQQAYQASARIISTSQQLFTTLLQSF